MELLHALQESALGHAERTWSAPLAGCPRSRISWAALEMWSTRVADSLVTAWLAMPPEPVAVPGPGPGSPLIP